MKTFLSEMKFNRNYSFLEKLKFWLATALNAIAITAIFSEERR